jgi:hypothetical protein
MSQNGEFSVIDLSKGGIEFVYFGYLATIDLDNHIPPS